jgi:hypothetical protein
VPPLELISLQSAKWFVGEAVLAVVVVVVAVAKTTGFAWCLEEWGRGGLRLVTTTIRRYQTPANTVTTTKINHHHVYTYPPKIPASHPPRQSEITNNAPFRQQTTTKFTTDQSKNTTCSRFTPRKTKKQPMYLVILRSSRLFIFFNILNCSAFIMIREKCKLARKRLLTASPHPRPYFLWITDFGGSNIKLFDEIPGNRFIRAFHHQVRQHRRVMTSFRSERVAAAHEAVFLLPGELQLVASGRIPNQHPNSCSFDSCPYECLSDLEPGYKGPLRSRAAKRSWTRYKFSKHVSRL